MLCEDADMTVRVFSGGFGSFMAEWAIQFHNPVDKPRMERLRELLKDYEASLVGASRASLQGDIAQFVACQSESHRLEAAITMMDVPGVHHAVNRIDERAGGVLPPDT
jgi:hypothetical protein